jgi:hypothetical protein
MIGVAQHLAEDAAAHSKPIVVCPPLCSFNSATVATEQGMHQAFALSVECDQHTADALDTLIEVLGWPTLVVRSGGE